MEKEIKLEEKCTTGAPKKKKMSRKRKKELIFVAVLLAYPVIQFLATWIFVNSYSIILSFEKISLEGNVSFAGFDNFINVIKRIFDPNFRIDYFIKWCKNSVQFNDFIEFFRIWFDNNFYQFAFSIGLFLFLI